MLGVDPKTISWVTLRCQANILRWHREHVSPLADLAELALRFSSKPTMMSEAVADDVAFLLTWDGTAWRDVVRLRQGHVATIGRSANNRIVLQDDACSRNHCEIFFSEGEWRLRDLGSRNGTIIRAKNVTGDTLINSGDVISIGECRLAFTTNLASAPTSPPDKIGRAHV